MKVYKHLLLCATPTKQKCFKGDEGNKTWECLKKNLKNSLNESLDKLTILITNKGGHNGFHSHYGCWSDEAVKNWLLSI